MSTETYTIPNISCHHCVKTIKSELSDLEGVSAVDGSPETKQITVTFDQPATEAKIIELLKSINYPPAE